MVQYQIKLRPSISQETQYDQWLFHLASVYNWAVSKIELNAPNRIYRPKQDFQNMLADHGPKLGIPSHTQGVLCRVHDAWKRCFKKLGGKTRLKGMGNRPTSIPFPDPIQAPKGNRITLPGLGGVRFHQRELPAGKIKCGRLVKRATGWYSCLFIGAEPKPVILSGPAGLTGLSARHWSCPCGAEHDRDVHAALNTLIAAAGYAVEVAYA